MSHLVYNILALTATAFLVFILVLIEKHFDYSLSQFMTGLMVGVLICKLFPENRI